MAGRRLIRRGARRVVRRKGIRRTGRRLHGGALGVVPYATGAANFGVHKRRGDPLGQLLPRTNLRTMQKGYQRVRGRTAVRRKFSRDQGGYTQWIEQKFRKTLGKCTQRKLNLMGFHRLIYSWRSVARLEGNGNLLFNHFYTAPSCFMPLFMVEVNKVRNVVGGATIEAPPVWTCQRHDTNGYVWSFQAGVDNTGASNANWITERNTGVNNADQFVHDHSLLKWFEARLDLWGCKKAPTKFVIELIQLDEDVQPNTNATNSDGAYVDFWDSEFKPYVFNPSVNTIQYGVKRMKRVLDSKVVYINPTSSTESDVDPHCKTVRMFYNLNRQTRYDWKDQVTTILADPTMESNAFNQAIDAVQTQVAPKARLYFMIKAAKFHQDISYAAQTSDYTPSINMQFRVAHYISK